MDGSCLTLVLCPDPQCLQQTDLLALHKRLVCHQGAIKGPLLVVTPDLSIDRLCSVNSDRVTPATQAVDKRIPSIIRTLTWRLPLLLRSDGGLSKVLGCC